MKKSLLFSSLLAVMVLTSCISNKQTTDYPNLSSVQQKKFGYQAHSRKTFPHQKRIDNVSSTNYLPSSEDALKSFKSIDRAHSKEFAHSAFDCKKI